PRTPLLANQRSPKRAPKPDRRAREPLAASRAGCTETIMLAARLHHPQMVEPLHKAVGQQYGWVQQPNIRATRAVTKFTVGNALMTWTLFLILLLPMGLCWNPARATGETFTGS